MSWILQTLQTLAGIRHWRALVPASVDPATEADEAHLRGGLFVVMAPQRIKRGRNRIDLTACDFLGGSGKR